ncbi:hypothetical protein QOT17_002355, partial [Balamuthia mandrillaris]
PSAASSGSLPQGASLPSAGGLQPPSRSLEDPHFQQKKRESNICLVIPPEIALLQPSVACSCSLPQAASPPSAGGLRPPSRSLVDPHFQQKKCKSNICLTIPPEIALLRPSAASSGSLPQAASPPSAGGLRPPSRSLVDPKEPEHRPLTLT